MTITIKYPSTVRTWPNFTQKQINSLITYISHLQETQGEVPVKITVTD